MLYPPQSNIGTCNYSIAVSSFRFGSNLHNLGRETSKFCDVSKGRDIARGVNVYTAVGQ